MNLNHLEEVKETYFQHFFRALVMSFSLLVMAFVCMTHALLPFIFTSYVSNKVREINSSLDLLNNNGI
jgi:hypothetical protein